MASERRHREEGSTPARGAVVRQRVDDDEALSDDDSHASSMSDSSEDKDKAWHETKGNLPYVPVGSSFEVSGVPFKRSGNRDAKCLICEREFGPRSYHQRGLNAHAQSCSAKEQRLVQREERAAMAATAAMWHGQITYTHTFEGDVAVEVIFEKILIGDAESPEKGLKCSTCHAELRQTAEFYQRQHVKGKHTPPSIKAAAETAKVENKKAEKRKQAFGAGGASAAANFFGRAKEAGKVQEEALKKRQEDVENARTSGTLDLLPPPPPPPLFSSRRSSPTFPSNSDILDMPPARTTRPLLVVLRPETNFNSEVESRLRSQHDELARLRALVANSQGDYPFLEEDVVVVEEGRAPAVCRGLKVDLPEPTLYNYPVAVDEFVPNQTWTTPGDDARVRSKFCLVVVEAPRATLQPSCEECIKLGGDTNLLQIVKRAWDTDLHTTSCKNNILTPHQLSKRHRHRTLEWRRLSLKNLTQESKMRRLQKVASSTDRIVAALATRKLPRLHIIARRLKRSGATVATIAKQFDRAVEGYVPKGDFERMDYQKAFVHLALGGRRALRLAMVDDGAPSKNTLKRRNIVNVPRHIACAGMLKINSLRLNMRRTIGSSWPSTKAVHHLAMDNVNLDERFRYNFDNGDDGENTGGLRIARESRYTGDHTIKSHADAVLIGQALKNGDILVAKEATVLCVVRNSNPPRITPVFTSGTGKVRGYGKGADDLAWIVKTALQLWRTEFEEKFGFVGSVATDADATNFKAHALIGLDNDMPDGELRDLLSPLVLIDLKSDSRETCSCTDDQHNGKNHRAKLICKGGFVIDRLRIQREEMIATVRVYTGTPVNVLEGYWPPPSQDDHQNVSSMVKGMIELSKLETVTDFAVDVAESRRPGHAERLRELRPLSVIAQCWVFLFTKHDVDLSAHVTNLGKFAAALFVVKRHSAGSLAAQTVRSIARAISSHIKCIARAQLANIKEFYLFIDATHLLEQAFGISRSLCASQRNFDLVQLEDRMSTIVGLQDIYFERPEWREDPRRLARSFDHWNTRSWKGSVDPTAINLKSCWVLGIREGVAALRKTRIYDERELGIAAIVTEDKTTSLLHWNGEAAANHSDDDEELEEAPTPAPTPAAEEGDDVDNHIGEEEDDDRDAAEAGDAEAAEAAQIFEEELDSDPAEVTLPTYITDNPLMMGEKCYIARIVKEMGKEHELLKTTARFGPGGGRVAHASSHVAQMPAQMPMRSNDDAPAALEPLNENIHVGDHAAALVSIEKIPTVVVVEVAGLQLPNGAAATTSGVTVDELADTRSVARVRPLLSVARAGALYFTGESSFSRAGVFSIAGSALSPLTLRPDSAELEGPILLAADINALADCAKLLWLRIADEPGSIADLVKVNVAAAHHDTTGRRLFTTELRAVHTSRAGGRRGCPICSKDLPDLKAALAHSAYHMVHTPTSMPQQETCPLCFGSSKECPPYLIKGSSTTPQPRIVCSTYAPAANNNNPEQGVKLQGASLEKSSASNPSTNRPIVCPACHPDLVSTSNKRKPKNRPAVWSYNMLAHWQRLHASSVMPSDLATAIELAPTERSDLKL
jgi:hypothetical protein